MNILTIAPYVVIVALGGYIGWLKYDRADFERALMQEKLDQAKKDKESSDKIIAQVTEALNTSSQKKDTYVEKIHMVPASPNDEACRKSERMRVGSQGVRDIVSGSVGGK